MACLTGALALSRAGNDHHLKFRNPGTLLLFSIASPWVGILQRIRPCVEVFVLRLILLLMLPLVAGAVPQPIRDTAYDWRCLDPVGQTTYHQRLDTAIYACQVKAEANPGTTYYIEAGRYRVRVEPTTTPTPDLTYRSTAPGPHSVHPDAPAGSLVEVRYLEGAEHEVRPNGAVSCVGSQCSIAVRIDGGAWETWTW